MRIMHITITLFVRFQIHQNLPLKIHVIFGFGAPAARQIIVASLPSKTVTFFGVCSIIGVDANEKILH